MKEVRGPTLHPLLLCVLLLLCSSCQAARNYESSNMIERGRSSPYSPTNSLPVVFWHGMGDSCCNEYSLGTLTKLVEDKVGVFVYSIATGSTPSTDTWSSFFGNVNDQVALTCDKLRGIPELKDGFNMVGFSQGGQFLRAVVERCHHTLPPIHTLVTIGAQHQGVMSIPGCIYNGTKGICTMMQRALSTGAYLPLVRNAVVQAQYFKDPHHLDQYYKYNTFLPDINNEAGTKSEQYRANLAALQKLVLVRFTDDTTVEPRDSAWFSFYNGTTVIPLEDQPIYQEDWIGLRALDEQGRLVYDECPGEHMHFTKEWFEINIVDKYLAKLESL